MASGDSQRDDVVIERRRTALIGFAAMVVVLIVLASGGALGWGAAVASGAVFAALVAVYLATAGLGDAPRRAATDARGAPDAARGVDEHVRVVLDALPEPVIVVREGGRVDALNAAARRELRALAVDEVFANVVREPQVLEAVLGALNDGRSGEVEFKDAAPRERYLRALVAPIRGPEGETRRAVIVIRDESGIKRAERARADFLANASHELRTPLASLAGFIETLGGHAREDEAARDRFLSIMTQQAERMRRLIDDLLSLSRIEQSEHVPPRGNADLAKIASDVVDALAPLAADRDVTIDLRLGVERARVVGDRDELVQVIQNLVDNAIKYSEDGGKVVVELGVAATATAAGQASAPLSKDSTRLTLLDPGGEPDKPYAWLCVSDQGRGIKREHLPRLSERFFRGDSEDVASTAGTGLGLAIVRHVMARHRGGVTVESALGAGSRFTVFLRCNDAARLGASAATSNENGARAWESPTPAGE